MLCPNLQTFALWNPKLAHAKARSHVYSTTPAANSVRSSFMVAVVEMETTLIILMTVYSNAVSSHSYL